MTQLYDIWIEYGLIQVHPKDRDTLQRALPVEVARNPRWLRRGRPGLIRLGWEHDKVKALSILLDDMKVYTKPAPIEYRIPRVSIREAKRLALPYFQQAQAQHPEKQWWPPDWSRRWKDPMSWSFTTACVQDGSPDDDMMIYVAMDKLDGHYVSRREETRYMAQWKRDSEFRLRSDDLMKGDESERLRAASWILEHMQHPAARELLEWERDNNPYESVRALIGVRLGRRE